MLHWSEKTHRTNNQLLQIEVWFTIWTRKKYHIDIGEYRDVAIKKHQETILRLQRKTQPRSILYENTCFGNVVIKANRLMHKTYIFVHFLNRRFCNPRRCGRFAYLISALLSGYNNPPITAPVFLPRISTFVSGEPARETKIPVWIMELEFLQASRRVNNLGLIEYVITINST